MKVDGDLPLPERTIRTRRKPGTSQPPETRTCDRGMRTPGASSGENGVTSLGGEEPGLSFTVHGVAAPQEIPEGGGRPKDIADALTKIRALVGESADIGELRIVVHDGPPVSKARARFAIKSRHHYTPETTRTAEDALAWRFRALGRPALSKCVAVVATFFRPNYQRIDIDNLTKLVFDAATRAGLWTDDCHVTAQASFLELDVDRPRTVVAICPTTSTLDRSARFTCRRCGTLFNRWGVAAQKCPPQFCSRACRYGAIRQEKAHPGQGVGPKGQPAARCVACSAALSKRSYIRCRSCWMKARREYVS